MTPKVCLVMHDVAPATWPRCRAIMERLARTAPAPWTLLAVPNYHRSGRLDRDSTFRREVDLWLDQGSEIALHGYYHLDPGATRGPLQHLKRRIYTAGEGEFSGLSYASARRRIRAGVAVLARAGWHADGFVAPAWLTCPASRRAIRDAGFRYTSSLREITGLPSERRLAGRSFCYSARSGPRRVLSRLVNTRLFRGLRDEPVVRVALHPADAEHPALMDHAQWLVDQLLETREPVVKRDLVQRPGPS